MNKTKIHLFQSYSDEDTTGRVRTELGNTYFYNVICDKGEDEHSFPDVSCS